MSLGNGRRESRRRPLRARTAAGILIRSTLAFDLPPDIDCVDRGAPLAPGSHRAIPTDEDAMPPIEEPSEMIDFSGPRNEVPSNWDDLFCVLAVARAGSLKLAASRLNVTESTLSRRIRRIENVMGFPLFQRTPAGMTATDAAERLTRHLARAEAEIESGLEIAGNEQGAMRGLVRLTSVPIIINRLVIPNLEDFAASYPEIELEFAGLPAHLSLMRRETDIAIRLTRPEAELDAITRRVGVLEYGAYCAASVAQGTDGETDLEWLTFGQSLSGLSQSKWILDRARESGERIAKIYCNDTESLIEMAKLGHGKALLPKFVASTVPEIREIAGYENLPSREIWSLVHPDCANSPKIEAASNWLKNLFERL